LLAITKLLDIEEDIWSPTYGLKGKLDATVQGIISDPSSSSSSVYRTAPSYTQTNTPLPLELKTGRSLAGMEHRAQTMLYTLLLSERYGVDTKDGLLFYTQSEGEVVRVPRGRNEIRGLIGARNEMAAYMWRRIRKGKAKAMDMDVDIEDAILGASNPNPVANEEVKDEPFLPAPIDDERLCKRCYALDTCLLFRKTHPNHSSSAPTKRLTYDPPIPPFLAPILTVRYMRSRVGRNLDIPTGLSEFKSLL
jgi:DNA replication ATP-dependent helicase Dna2